MATFKISGAAPALLLTAALLAAGANAGDWVTVAACRGTYKWLRLRHYPEDISATRLLMKSCGLTELNTADVANLRQVQDIYLNVNSISQIDTSAFSTAPSLTVLSLHGNKFREPPVFAEGSCPSLTALYLSNNLLTAVGDEGTYSACSKLEELYFDYNQITYLNPNAFSPLPKLKTLSLNDNSISFVPGTIFVGNRQLTTLHLYNNRLTHLPPNFASSLKRAGAGLGEFFFHGNPWRCFCLVDLMADVKRAGVGSYYYDDWHHYDGTTPVCVYTGVGACAGGVEVILVEPPRTHILS